MFKRVLRTTSIGRNSIRQYSVNGKELRYGTEARQMMLEGVEALAKVVAVTLGPKVCLFILLFRSAMVLF